MRKGLPSWGVAGVGPPKQIDHLILSDAVVPAHSVNLGSSLYFHIEKCGLGQITTFACQFVSSSPSVLLIKRPTLLYFRPRSVPASSSASPFSGEPQNSQTKQPDLGFAATVALPCLTPAEITGHRGARVTLMPQAGQCRDHNRQP